MPEDLKEPQVPQPEQSGDGRGSRAAWLVVAALVLVVAGVGGLVLLDRGDDESQPTDTDAAEPATGAPTDVVKQRVTQLRAPASAGQERCAVPNAGILARHQLAFDGTVTAIADGEVTLQPSMFYAGEPADLVVVKAPPEQLRGLLLSVEFEKGGRYLVAADGGRVAICGYSGRWSEELEELYLEAFPG